MNGARGSSENPKDAAKPSEEGWRIPPAVLALPEDEVHVWRISLDAGPHSLERCKASLADDELERARRFRLPLHQARYIHGRAALRAILARYQSRPAESLRFIYGPSGKPALEDTRLQFNLSHSGGMALCAVARGRNVGVDLEAIRERRPVKRLAERFFATGEAAVLRELNAADQTAAFFQYWTLKEAYIKARGDGLAIPLDRFEVQWRGDNAEAGLHALDEPDESKRWTLITLGAVEGCAAALAVEGRDWRLRRWIYAQ
ncbi:MAG: 4'-phosphopantetheinyl transferase superfamily protein [Candidatus Hydrogenedentes bacterium]|nr:4'-phosphopantetheinyl transferase superfamily protein [Candidatus Hydrogenedentota bacterium]